MIKLFKQSFIITNNCIIIVTPLIIFITLLSVYYNYANSYASGILEHIFSVITIFIIICGFFSAWLYMAKKAFYMSKKVFLFDNERNKELIGLFSALYKGVGRLFLPIIGMISLLIIINLLLYTLIAFITTEIPSLYFYRNLVYFIGQLFILFLSMYLIPEIVFYEKNALFALSNAIYKVFTNFKESLVIFIWIIILLLILRLLYSLTVLHPIYSFLLLILLYYVLVYIIMLLFTYYEQKFISNNSKT